MPNILDLVTKSNYELNPATNLEQDPSLLNKISRFKATNQEFFQNNEPLQIGLFGPEDRKIGKSKFDYDVLPEDILYWDNLEKIRSTHQTGIGQLGNAFVNSLAEIVGGTIEGLGYLGEIGKFNDLISGTEEEFGNAITRFGKSIKDASNTAFPIYTDFEQGKFAPGNWSWWMQNLPSIASTASLMIPSAIATGVLSTATKTLNIAGKLGRYEKEIGAAAKTLTQAILSRHMENMMEASQSFDEIYNYNINELHLKPEDAKKNAAIGAKQVYNRNWVMLLQDIPQYATLFLGGKYLKGMMAAGGEEAVGIEKALGKSTKNARLNRIATVLGDMVGEGGEEAYQYIVQKEGSYTAQLAIDPNTSKSSFNDRLRDYIDDGDLWSSFFFGALGSGVMQVAGPAINEKLTKGSNLNLRIDDVKSWGPELSRNLKTILAARDLGNTHLTDSVEENGLSNIMAKSSLLGNLGKFREFVEITGEMSTEEATKFGLSENDIQELKNRKETYLSKIDRFEQIYNDNIKKLNATKIKSKEHVAYISRNEFLLEQLNDRLNNSVNKVEEIKSRITNYDQLSYQGQSIINLEAENIALNKIKKVIKNQMPSDKEDPNYESYTAKLKSIDEEISSNKEAVKVLKEERSTEDTANDKKKKITSKAVEEFQNEIDNITTINESISDLQEDLEKLYKGEMPYKVETPKPEDTKPQYSAEIPKVGDAVQYTNPETGEISVGVTKKFDEKNGFYEVQFLDQSTGNPIGPVQRIAAENLKIIIDSEPTDNNTDPIDDKDFNEQDNKDLDNINNIDRASADTEVSYAHYDKDNNNKLIIRDHRLAEVLSDPKLDLSTVSLEFHIDFGNEEYWKNRQDMLSTIKRKDLSKEEIGNLLKASRGKGFNALVDTLPIKIYVKIGQTSYQAGTYMRNSNSTNGRTIRRNVLSDLLAGNKVTANPIKKTKGVPNNTSRFGKRVLRNVSEAFGLKSHEITIGVGNSSGRLAFGTDEVDLTIPVKKGAIFAVTSKTANSDKGIIRLNPVKLSREHADILFSAFQKRARDGYQSKSDDKRVEGLTAGNIIDLLSLSGEKLTSLTHADNETRLPEYMKDKQLYVAKGPDGELMIHYGSNVAPLFVKDKESAKAIREDFIDWAIKNKNYPVYISNESLGLTNINKQFSKKFKLGSLVHEGNESYASMLIKNNMILTDVEQTSSGSLFTAPFLDFDPKSILSSTKGQKSVDKPKTSPNQATTNEVIASPSKMAKAVEGSQVLINIATIADDGKTRLSTPVAIGSVVKNSNGELVFRVDPYLSDNGLYQSINNKPITDPNIITNLIKEAHLSNEEDVVISSMATKDQVVDTKVEKIKEEAGQKVIEEKSKDSIDMSQVPDDLKSLGLESHLDGEVFRKAQYYPYELQDLRKELRQLRRMFGRKLPNDFKEVDKVIVSMVNGSRNFAKYSHDAILLYEGAEKGTVYHEAFHRVSLGYFTPSEREQMYDAAKKQYNLQGKSNDEVEEFLAEKFRDYVIAQENSNIANRIKTFFARLYNYIKSWFAGPTKLTSYEVDAIFKAIKVGKFRSNKVLYNNLNNLSKKEYFRSFYGRDFSAIDTAAELREVIKGLTYSLIKYNGVKDYDNIGKLNPKPLLDELIKARNTFKARLADPNLNEASKQFLTIKLNLYNDILGYNEATDEYLGFKAMYDLVLYFVKSMGLNPNKTDEIPDEYADQEVDLSIAGFDKMSQETSVKENALGIVKMVVALLPDGDQIDPFTGMRKFVDYNNTWNNMLADLYEYNNIDQMIERLKELSVAKPYYSTLVNILERNKDGMIKPQFEATIRKHRHSYINALEYTNKKFNKDTKKWEIETDFVLSDADVRNLADSKVKEWNLLMYMSNDVAKAEGSEPGFRPEFINSTIADYDNLNSRATALLKSPEQDIEANKLIEDTISLLAKIKINIDEDTIRYIMSSGKSDEITNLANFIITDLNKVFYNVIKGHNSKKTHISTLYNDNAIKSIARDYANSHKDLANTMVLGPDGATYYSYSNHNTVTSFIRDTKLDPTVAEERQQKVFNKRSKILYQLINEPDIRNKVRVLTFSGIFRPSEGDEGRDYFKMSLVEDYKLKLHATLKGLITFPTMSDKKTYMMLEGFNTINVELNQDLTMSEKTMDQLFDHVLDEYDRIKAARQLRDNLNKAKEEKDEATIKMIEDSAIVNYHYVYKKDGTKDFTKGNAYDFVAFKGISYDNFDEVEAKQKLQKAITKLAQMEFDYAKSFGVRVTSDTLIKAYQEKYGYANAFMALMNEFVIKSIDNNIELHKAFIGDPAFFKSNKENEVGEDLSKRLGSLIASGEEMMQSVVGFGDDLLESKYNVATIKTQKLKSAYYEDLVKIYVEKKGLSEEDARAKLKPYTEIEQADGQSFITSKLYRSISIRIGEWSTSKERAYLLLEHPEELGYTENIQIDIKNGVKIYSKAKKINIEFVPGLTKLDNGNYLVKAYRTEDSGIGSKGFGQRGEGLYLSITSPYHGKNIYTVEFEISPSDIVTYKKEYDGTIPYDSMKSGNGTFVDKVKEVGGKAFIGGINSSEDSNLEIVLYDKDIIDKVESSKIKVSNFSTHETLYDIIGNEEEAEAMNVVLNPLKTVYFGLDSYNNLAVPIYDKMSMAPLFRRAVKGKQIEELLDRMELTGKYANKPGLQKVDMIKMDSATKVGGRGAFPLFKDKDQTTYNEMDDIAVFPQQFVNLRRQQVTPVHEASRRPIGTQSTKVAMGNINMEGKVYTFRGQEKTGKEIVDIISTSLGTLSYFGKDRIDAKYGFDGTKVNPRLTAEVLRDEAKTAGLPFGHLDVIKTDENGKFYLEPDANVNRKWIDSRFISTATKEIIDRRLRGGQLIQVSNLGYRSNNVVYDLEHASEDNRIKWLKDVHDIPFVHIEDGKVVPMGCVVPVSVFKHIIPGYDIKSFSEKVQYISENRVDIFGYRIPTQGQNSTIAMQVVGILPEQAGDSIILPSEFTALTGSDFDIDKLFIAYKNYRNGREVEFIEGEDEKSIEKAYKRMIYYTFSVHKKQLPKSVIKTYIERDYDAMETSDKTTSDIPEIQFMIDQLIDNIKTKKELLEVATNSNEKDLLSDEINDLEYELILLKDSPDIFDPTALSNKNEQKNALDFIKKSLIDNGFLSTIEEFSKLDVYKRNIPQAIENRLLDGYLSVLLSEEHILKTTSPLGGLKDMLTDLASKVRKLTENKNKQIMDMFTPRYQSNVKFRNTSGKAGVGPFALHNAHHVLTQLAKYGIRGSVSELQNIVDGFADLSAHKGYDGIDILDWLSALIDAHVDMAKDTYIMDLNVNPFTYDIISYLIRSGVGIQSFKFLAQPIIKEASLFKINNPDVNFGNVIRSIRKNYEDRLKNDFKIDNDDIKSKVTEYKEYILVKENSLENELFELESIPDTAEFLLKQLAFLDKLSDIKEYADILTTDVQSVQIDTRKYGSNLRGLYNFLRKVEKSYNQSEEGLTENFDKILSYDPEKLIGETEGSLYINDYFKNGVVHMIDMFSNLKLEGTKAFRNIADSVLTLSQLSEYKEGDVNKVYDQIYSAILGKFIFANSQMFNITPEKLKEILVDNKSVFDRYVVLKVKYPELFTSNAFLNRLNTFFDESSTLKKYFINKGLDYKDSFEIDAVNSAWEELMTHQDPEVEKLAIDLFIYSFYTTGFNNTIYGFNSLTPPSFMKGIRVGDKTLSINDSIRSLLDTLDSGQYDEYFYGIIDDVLHHLASTGKAIEEKNLMLLSHDTGDNKYYTVDRDSKRFDSVEKGLNTYVPYFKYGNNLYKLVGYLEISATPIYIRSSRKGVYDRGRLLLEYGMDKSIIDSNNIKELNTDSEQFKQDVFKQFGENYVNISNEEILNGIEVQNEQEPIEHISEESNNTDMTRLSSPEKPLTIYVDGSHIKGSDVMGYGAYTTYNGESYGISGAKSEVNKFRELFPNINVSNPTMEMLGLSATLKAFSDTSEHLLIRQDYSGAINYSKLWNHSEGSLQRADKPWKPKEEYIKYLVENIEKYIEQIESNGGSVKLQWVPGHIDNSKITEYKELLNSQSVIDEIKTGNDNADKIAKSTNSKNTINELLSLRELVSTEPMQIKNQSENTDIEQQGEEIKKYCKGE